MERQLSMDMKDCVPPRLQSLPYGPCSKCIHGGSRTNVSEGRVQLLPLPVLRSCWPSVSSWMCPENENNKDCQGVCWMYVSSARCQLHVAFTARPDLQAGALIHRKKAHVVCKSFIPRKFTHLRSKVMNPRPNDSCPVFLPQNLVGIGYATIPALGVRSF